MANTREIVLKLEIAAPPEEIWRALTDPRAIEGWLAVRATFDDGQLRVSWSEDPLMDFGRVIESTPPTLQRFTETPWGDKPRAPRTRSWQIEAAGDKSILTLTHGPFSESDEGLVAALTRGWGAFMAALKHYVEKFPGAVTASRGLAGKIHRDLEEAWRLATNGLDLKVGDHVELLVDEGMTLSGKVELLDFHHYLGIELDAPGGALLRFEMMPGYGTCMLFTYGEHGTQAVDRTWAGIVPWVKRILGEESKTP